MKKITIFILAMFLISMLSIAQSEKGLAKVQKIKGKEVYIYCEPILEYEIIEKVTSITGVLGSLSGTTPEIDDMIKEMITSSISRELKNKIGKFDAVLTTDGESAVLIKFKADNDEKRGIGIAQKIKGKYIFLYSEPVDVYESIDNINSLMAQLFGTPTIKKMINEMADKAVSKEKKGKVKPFEGIITTDGKDGILIKFM